MTNKNVETVYLGCHLSSAKGFAAMGKDAVSIGANTFAFFTRNPRGGKAKEIDPEDVARLLTIMESHKFGKLVAHAPYTLNPCSQTEKTRQFAHMAMTEDLERMEYLPGNYYNFHPGSHVGQGSEKGIEMIAELLNRVIKPEQSTTILLETMAGKGSEIGRNFEELAAILERVNHVDKMGVCLDTCHVSDGGYPIGEDLDGVLDQFDRIIGLEKLKALHINDSQNPVGARKDRHACIGEGHIGKEAILRVVHHPKLIGLPCILETPQENLEGYGREIAMLREKSADSLERQID
ncbi:MAG: deoxyribonuclease IV [Emergencia sp.]|nr:deoxyribonuclease IV [Emergencia sp.]